MNNFERHINCGVLPTNQVTTAQNHLKNLPDNLTTIERHCEPVSETTTTK